jgi:glycine amidinotransferase/scyllo-inosamine-4-phosphate amidinotransferase 1
MKLSSHDEWNRLREVIVGTARGTRATLTWTRPDPVLPQIVAEAVELAARAYPSWYLEEVEEDLDGLAALIVRYGARVHRPAVPNLSRMFATPFWQSTGNNLYNARDLHLVVGNYVIESPSHVRSRYFEPFALYDIWYRYLDEGFTWITAPRPRLDGVVSEPYYRDEAERPITQEDVRHRELAGGRIEKLHRLTEREILFEAANTLRMGRDLLYLVSSSGNRKGARWLQQVLGEGYRVHTTDRIYRSSHIDSTVMCLRPGLVLLNSARVDERTCPEIFASWEKLYFGDVAPVPEAELAFQNDVREPLAARIEALGFQTNLHDMSSPWVGMNLLSLDPETVMVDERQTGLIRLLESRRFTVIPVRMRHMYTQSGGIHCATLDTVRDGGLERYFD